MEERQENSKEKEPELIPLEEDLDKIYHDHTEKSFKTEIRRKNETRFKLLQSLFLAMAFMILGWSKGQLGPAFMDLLFITGADLKAGSGFMTSYYAGRMLGSILAGVIYLKVNKYLIFVFSISINGIIVAAIPWCSQYELMMAAHVIHGVSGGVLDVAITSEAVKIWGPTARGRSYLQILAASFAVSGLLAPMATAPFLLQTKDNICKPCCRYREQMSEYWRVNCSTNKCCYKESRRHSTSNGDKRLVRPGHQSSWNRPSSHAY
ncbi:sodium-dependent glucose transporter 1-like [Ylistrum balloti]|uniref:sodium-dependent glucose transporter 1-like n=1 Tax=Ylistrum balloti TaxID=509963 RepID=UPI002905D354|nr:sodium-dependent glucose transporter 1-like [Ylistrum balloti]